MEVAETDKQLAEADKQPARIAAEAGRGGSVRAGMGVRTHRRVLDYYRGAIRRT